MGREIHVYTSEIEAGNARRILRDMFLGLRNGRYLAYRLFWREIKGQYSKSVFGVAWDFVEPLVWAGLFIALYQSGVFNSEGFDIKKSVFVVFGILLWQTFVDSVIWPLDIVRKSQTMLSHQRIPPEALLISVLLRVLFFFSFRIVAIAIVAVALEEFSPIGFLKFLLLCPSVVLAGFSIGVFLEPFNEIYSDIGRFVRIVIRPLMFASPVIFPGSRLPVPPALMALNPAATTLDTLRQLATRNACADPQLFWTTCAASAALLFLGWFVFHVSIPILADRG